MQRTLIWDAPTRLFHWALALSFLGAWLTTDSDQWLSVHVFLGYLMLGLVGFRVIWGLVGTHHARFGSFWFGPREAFVYLKKVLAGNPERHVGHNPTGSLAIYLLLLLVLVVGFTGILRLGGEEQQGALAGWTSILHSPALRIVHKIGAWVMLLLVLGHLTGVVVESVLHRENLARSMITGTKMADTTTPIAQPHWLVATLLLVLMTAFGGWWFFYAYHEPLETRLGRVENTTEEPPVKFVGARLADNAQWRDECGSCHAVFYPALLPARSWQKIMADQSQHFGTDLGLDATTAAALLAFMTANSADQHLTEAAFKIEQSIPRDATPLRVTDTPYWINKHQEIAAADWASPLVKSKNNCAACHSDADKGTFEDAAMQIPGPPLTKP